MPLFNYQCTALPVMATDAEGGLYHTGTYSVHPMDIAQGAVDHPEFAGPSRMGTTVSGPGQPPPVVFCAEHQGWAKLA